MSLEYGSLMIDLEGTELTPEERVLLQHKTVGGVILFARNFHSITQLKTLVQDIRTTSKKALLIAVDHEGGRVWRFEQGFTKLPAAQHYGELYAENPDNALHVARNAGWIMAAELLDCGIDFSLAPVLDIDKGVSSVIGDRAFSSDPHIISRLAGAFIEGMNHVGMAATGKHFPGHGGCAPDTHFAAAIDNRTLDLLLKDDLIPFRDLSSKLGAIMPAHVLYPTVDSVPAGFSKIWLQDILRDNLGFKGAIISDCLSMKGAAIGGDFVVRARMALDAGCDMVILCQQTRELMQWVLDNVARRTSTLSNQRLSQLAGKFQNEARKAPRPSMLEYG